MPRQDWSDLAVGDRVEVVYRDSDLCGREGIITEVDGYGARIRLPDGSGVGFSHRSSLKKLSKPATRPVSPVFYTLKEAH